MEPTRFTAYIIAAEARRRFEHAHTPDQLDEAQADLEASIVEHLAPLAEQRNGQWPE